MLRLVSVIERPSHWRSWVYWYEFMLTLAKYLLELLLVGSHVVYTLLKTRQYKVISIDNHHNSLPASLARVSELALEEHKASLGPDAQLSQRDIDSTIIDAHDCDLTNHSAVREIFGKYYSSENGKGGIWGVVHIAAYKAVGESTSIPLTYYQNNVSATISLLSIMLEFDCTRLVYSSSATVYGTPPEVPIPERTRREADSPYGRTKVMCEMVVEDLCESSGNAVADGMCHLVISLVICFHHLTTTTTGSTSTPFQAISLRYFNPAGAHPSGRIGEDPRGRPGNLLPLLAHMAVGRVKDPVLKVCFNCSSSFSLSHATSLLARPFVRYLARYSATTIPPSMVPVSATTSTSSISLAVTS
ncbi:hypothetical protein HHX47_DHR1001685 [Lentinula edodes]|nr:hypothetical protein HHX47_DHR1001685 [Lentinula edodes]